MATGEYTHTSLQSLVDQLAQDLSDTGKVFFTEPELTVALVEALRLSNVLTARSRHTLQFNATAGTAWYDLAALAPAALSTTVTDRATIETMQYRLMERTDPAAGSTMTERYAFSELLRSLQQSRDRCLTETESTITRETEIAAQTGVDGALGTVNLDEAIAKVLRTVWIDSLGRRTVLRNSTDEGMMVAKAPDRRTRTDTPRRWSIIVQPQLRLQLDPIPDTLTSPAALQLWTVRTGGTLDTTANANTGTILGLPDDLAAGAGWDALELTLSKHGMGHDALRAQFAGRMGTLMRSLAASLPVVLQVAVNGRDVQISHVRYIDAKDHAWEGAARGIPRRAVVMGDWMGLYPVPDDAHSVEVTLVSKLTVPALADYVQIGRDQLSGILAWAKQLALFKVGGNPLAQAAGTAGLMIEQARAYNEERVRSCQYLDELLSRGLDSPASVLRDAPPVNLSGDPIDEASSRGERRRDSTYRPYNHPIGGR